MQINIIFETINREFYPRLFLSAYLVKKDNISVVRIGSFRSILRLIIREIISKKKTSEDKIIFFKDIWKNNELLIYIFTLFGYRCFAFHEEEYLALMQESVFSQQKDQIIDNKYFKLLDNFFTLNHKTKKIWAEDIALEKSKIINTGSLRNYYMQKVLKNGHFLNRFFEKKILICLNNPIFEFKKNNKKANSIIIKKNFLKKKKFSNITDLDRFISIKYTRNYLLRILYFIKKNPTTKFILRPYPHEEQYKIYYERLCKSFKNIELNFSNDIFYCFSRAKIVFTAPDTVSLEAAMFGLPTYVFYNKNDLENFFLFKDHKFLKSFPSNSFYNLKQFSQLIKIKINKKENNIFYKIFKQNNFFEVIYKSLNNLKKKESLFSKFKNIILKKVIFLLIRKTVLDILSVKVNKMYKIINFQIFIKKNNNIFKNIFAYFYFFNSDFKRTISYLLYKNFIGIPDAHSEQHYRNDFNNINFKELKKFIYYYKLLDTKFYNFLISDNNNIISLKKKSNLF